MFDTCQDDDDEGYELIQQNCELLLQKKTDIKPPPVFQSHLGQLLLHN